jgi:ABC-type multidrug transport system ATPase subunit
MTDIDEPTTHAALFAHDVRKEYGDVVALHDLRLEVARGELVALVGANGAGKSTFLRCATGLLEPSDGILLVEGRRAGSIEARAALSYIGDQPTLYDDLSVNEHIDYLAALHGVEGRPPSADQLLDVLNLTDRADDLPARFSRGLRQKTALVLGLVRPFSVLLVDEPFVGLDPAGQEALVDLLCAAAEAGAAVLVATHQLTFLSHATRCVALRDGALAYAGPPDRGAIDQFLD